MKIIVPYANDVSDPETFEAVQNNLEATGLGAKFIRMDQPNSYSLLINRLFEEGEKFIIVEHDVIVTRPSIEEIYNCKEPFCGWDGLLGCSKIDPAVCSPCPVPSNVVWYKMDAYLHKGLYARGIGFHDHVFISGYVINHLNRG